MIILNETSKAYFELINAHISKDQKVDLDKNFSSSVYGSIRHAVIEDKDTGKKIKLNGLAIASEVGELMENGLDAKIIILRLKAQNTAVIMCAYSDGVLKDDYPYLENQFKQQMKIQDINRKKTAALGIFGFFFMTAIGLLMFFPLFAVPVCIYLIYKTMFSMKKEMKKDRASFLSHADFLEQWVPKLK
tara:strand:+ start:786 stop:1352 length:567 start_codon:yes stop_codon:yes gene_type:complete